MLDRLLLKSDEVIKLAKQSPAKSENETLRSRANRTLLEKFRNVDITNARQADKIFANALNLPADSRRVQLLKYASFPYSSSQAYSQFMRWELRRERGAYRVIQYSDLDESDTA